MKFSIKIILSVITIISVIFSIAGFIIIYNNFQYSFTESVQVTLQQHRITQYGLESNIINDITNNIPITNEKIIEYSKAISEYSINNRSYFSIYSKTDGQIYSDFEKSLDVTSTSSLFTAETYNGYIKKIGSDHFYLMSSVVYIEDQEIYLVTIHDISTVYLERDRQLKDFLILDIAMITISSITISILCTILTRPIKELNIASKEITSGLYHKRIWVKSKDEIGQLANNFNLMSESIEDKISKLNLSVKQREDFVSSFSHEMKTPMTVIMGYSKLLKNNELDNNEKEKALEYIYNESIRLEQFSRKLLEVMSLSKDNISFEKINIQDFGYKIAQSCSPFLEDIKLVLDLSPNFVYADETLVSSLVINLIENAKKAKPKDNSIIFKGEKINQTDNNSENKNLYKISIIDKGIGISKEDIERVKEDFYMVDKSRKKVSGSTGLGLSICERIAKVHNTTLQIESEINVGTIVSFLLEVDA